MFPGMRRPEGGIGRDVVVCDGCHRKLTFYFQVGEMQVKEVACPGCKALLRLQGFRSWEKDGPPDPDMDCSQSG